MIKIQSQEKDEAVLRDKALKQVTKQKDYIFDGVISDALYELTEDLNYSKKEWEKFKKRLLQLHKKMGMTPSDAVINVLNYEVGRINEARKHILAIKNLLEVKMKK